MRLVLKQSEELESDVVLIFKLTYIIFCENPNNPFIQGLSKKSLDGLRRKRFNK